MTQFTPELGQLCFGNPTGSFALPEFVDALLQHIFGEIARVYGNLHQQDWRHLSDPGLPGIEVRPYYWGEDGDEDEDEAAKPNFAFGGVEIRWYKHPGRSMSCNIELTEADWVKWFDACLQAIRDHEEANRGW